MYNGVQARANNVRTISGVSQFERALKGYAAANGAYPDFGYSACLGLGYPDTNGDGQPDCGASDYPTPKNDEFNEKMLQLLANLPVVNARPVAISDSVTFMGGIVVHWEEFRVNGVVNPYYLMYALEGSAKDCGNSGVVDHETEWPNMRSPASQSYSWTGPGYTMCVVPLPNV